MSPLKIVIFTINISVISCVNVVDLGSNELEAGKDNLKCNLEADCETSKSNKWKETFAALKEKESVWIDKMKNYLDHVNFHIDILIRRKELSKITMELELTSKKDYLDNPFSSFALLKRSANVWPRVALQMASLPGELNSVVFNTKLARLHRKYESLSPTTDDVNEGIQELARQQLVYEISTEDMADWETPAQGSLFSEKDFLGFAKYYCDKAFGEKCQEWLDKAAEKNTNMLFSDDFLQLSFLSNCLNGNQTGANIYFKQLVERKSTFTILKDTILEGIFHQGCESYRRKFEEVRQINLEKINLQTNSES